MSTLTAQVRFIYEPDDAPAMNCIVKLEADREEFGMTSAFEISGISEVFPPGYAAAVTDPELFADIEAAFFESPASITDAQERLADAYVSGAGTYDSLTAADVGVGPHRIGGLGA